MVSPCIQISEGAINLKTMANLKVTSKRSVPGRAVE